MNGVVYVYVNEISEPFIVGIGFAVSWGLRALFALVLPYIYDNLPLYWLPMIQAVTGIILFVLYTPLYIETKGQTYVDIAKRFANFKYKMFTINEG